MRASLRHQTCRRRCGARLPRSLPVRFRARWAGTQSGPATVLQPCKRGGGCLNGMTWNCFQKSLLSVRFSPFGAVKTSLSAMASISSRAERFILALTSPKKKKKIRRIRHQPSSLSPTPSIIVGHSYSSALYFNTGGVWWSDMFHRLLWLFNFLHKE